MRVKYIFTCLHISCIQTNVSSSGSCDVPTQEQVEKLFNEHSKALHFCRWERVMNDGKK